MDENPTDRVEADALGSVEIPAHALWGPSTQRAIQNFPVSGRGLPARFVHALGLVKRAAALANREVEAVPAELCQAIEAAAREVAEGRLDDQFVVDLFQTGSGTSSNMNANEVIARRAHQLLGEGADAPHPNDHVNASQSSNDVMPTALHVAAHVAIHEDLLPALRDLEACLGSLAERFQGVVKLGRTHGMDATPIRLGQEVSGWGRQVSQGVRRVAQAAEALAELPIGGTAVGTGINCPPGFASGVVTRLSKWTGLSFREAENRFEAQGSRDAAVEVSSALRGLAVSLFKIAGDVALLGTGPRGGLGELRLPALQPGSSIMPGKVNPVICESVRQVAAQVIGNDAAIAVGGLSGQLELNTFLPLIARNLLESIELLAAAARIFGGKCLAGLEADAERCRHLVERSPALATALVPHIGYAAAAEIVKSAVANDRTILAESRDQGLLPEEELVALLDPLAQTGP